MTLAASGVAVSRLNFGPQGRAFTQVRVIEYLPELMSFQSYTELAHSFNVFSQAAGSNAQVAETMPVYHPADFPTYQNGRDVRISAGYVLQLEREFPYDSDVQSLRAEVQAGDRHP